MAAPHGRFALAVAEAIEETKKAIGGLGKIGPAVDDESLPSYTPPDYALAIGYNPGGVDSFDSLKASLSKLDLEQLILFLNANIKTLVAAAEARGMTFQQFIAALEAAFRAALMATRR